MDTSLIYTGSWRDSSVNFANENEGFIALLGIVLTIILTIGVAVYANNTRFEKNKLKQQDGNSTKSAEGGGLVADVIGGYVGAPGFSDTPTDLTHLDSIDWCFQLKIANPHKDAIVIKNVEARFIGRHGYGAESFAIDIYKLKGTVLKRPLKKPDDLPIVVEPESENTYYVDTVLKIYRKYIILKKEKAFAREEINSATYDLLRRKMEIAVETNKGKLKIKF